MFVWNFYLLKLRHIWPYLKFIRIFLETLKGSLPFSYLHWDSQFCSYPTQWPLSLMLLVSKITQRASDTRISHSLFLIQWPQDYAHSQGSSSTSQQGDWCVWSSWRQDSKPFSQHTSTMTEAGWGLMKLPHCLLRFPPGIGKHTFHSHIIGTVSHIREILFCH